LSWWRLVFLLVLAAGEPRTIMVFTRTRGYRHSSIPAGLALFRQLAAMRGDALVHAAEDASLATQLTATRPDLLVFLSTTGSDLLDAAELSALEAFLVGGGAWFGIHGAADALYGAPFYEELVGSLFASHPPGTALARVFKSSSSPGGVSHAVTAGLPESDFAIVDEWYNFKSLPPPNSTTVLLEVDENTYLGGTHGDFHPIMWSRIVRGARSAYTAIGHTEEAFSNGCFVSLCAGAIDWLLKRERVAANTTCVSATNVTTKQTTSALPCCTTRAFPPQNQRIKVTIGYAVGFTLGAVACFLLVCIAVTLRRRAQRQAAATQLDMNNV